MRNKRNPSKPTKDCFYCPFIPNCPDRKMAKKNIDKAANLEKDKVRKLNLMPPSRDIVCPNLFSKVIHRTVKARNLFLKHLHHNYDVKAGVFLWKHPDLLEYIDFEELGDNQLSSFNRCFQKIQNKRNRGVAGYHTYRFEYDNRTYTVKTEMSVHGYEQLYALYEERMDNT